MDNCTKSTEDVDADFGIVLHQPKELADAVTQLIARLDGVKLLCYGGDTGLTLLCSGDDNVKKYLQVVSKSGVFDFEDYSEE